MSGHSHFATIKRAKEAKDAQKGKSFSKHARAISLAVKAGGGPDPASNYKLRMAIEAARADNLPKDNIERAISKASTEAENLEEFVYEGFGPFGISVIVDVATDNRNRTAQELKNIFERGGGNLGGPGSVSYNFENKGMIKIEKLEGVNQQILDLIDLGVDDYEEAGNELVLYTPYDKTGELKDIIVSKNYKVISVESIKKAKNFVNITEVDQAKKIFTFVQKIEEYDDVQNVYTNVTINDDILSKIEL
jgi:YebC/PmpR family DNA-binding regulatory protein